ncbi:MAG TPA: hypothetical protein VI932_03370 [Bacteroidota bacterium]|nr:hypothetical protein [Bacteroidota bacterium]
MDGVTTAIVARRNFRASFRAAGRLLRLAKAGESLGRKRNPFPPLGHLLANIFLCSFAQRYLADDPGGIYLSLFLAVQCSLGVLITMSFVGRAGAEILRKTRLYPAASSGGYYFLLAGSLRRPELFLFAAVGSVFPAIVHSPGLLPSAGIVAISLFPLLTSQILCCAVSARMIRASRPLTGVILITIFAGVVVLASAFVFRTEALASSLPMIGWTASGITAFSTGQAVTGWKYLAFLALATAAVLAFFRK